MWSKIKLFFYNHWSGLTKTKRFVLVFAILLLTIFPAIAFANVSTFVLEIATTLISILVAFLGKLIAVILSCLVNVATYNNFINENVVTQGWKVVRDICNMFFVLGLLIIAFGTVLRLPNYSGKNSLKNLIVGAITVNFSRTICGLIIDFAQVIMLTFVNGFKDVGAGNLSQMLGLTTLFSVIAGDGQATVMDSIGIFTSYLLALVYLTVALVAILSMTIMLVQRAVMLWIYVILSPFPYLLSALPKTGSLGSKGNQWWTEFTGLVVIGPLLAFFLWLSFFTASGTSLSGTGESELDLRKETNLLVNVGVTESGTTQSIIKFLVSIGLLFGGMKIAQQSSSLVGGTIGAGMQRLQKLQKGATKKLTATAATTGKFLSRNALKGGGATLTSLSKNSNGTTGKTFQKIGAAASTWGGELADARKKEKVKNRLKTLEKLGLGVGDNTMEKFKDVVDDEGFKKVANLGKGTLVGTAVGFATANPLAGIAAGMTFGGASGVVEATGLNKKTGRTIKQFVNGTDAPIYEKAYNDYDKNIHDAGQNLITNKAAAKTKRDTAEQAAADQYKLNQNKNAYKTSLAAAKDNYKFDIQEAKRIYNIDEQDAKNKLQAEFLKAQNPKTQKANDFTYGNAATNQSGADKLKTDYETLRQGIINGGDSNEIKTEKLKKAEKQYKENIKLLYQNPAFNVKPTASRIAGYMGGAKFLNNMGDKMENYHPLQLTSDAAGSFLKDAADAKKAVEDYAQNGTITGKDFSGGTRRGLNKFQEKFLGELANPNNPRSAAALANLKAQIDNPSFNKKDDKNQKTMEAVLKGIAMYEKKNGHGSVARFQDLITSISAKKDGDDYAKILNDVKLRQVSDAAIAGDGSKSLKVNSFAKGKHNTNVIGVDFNKLSSIKDSIDSPNLTAGANIAPEKMAAVSAELTGLIDGELAELGQANQDLITQPLSVLEQRINRLRSYRANAFKSGNQNTITRAQNTTPELEQLSRARDLRQAKEKLADPSNLNNLSLKNTGTSLNSAKESHTTNLHEALHGFGIDNEKLTENIAQAMAQGSYKIDDAAAVAQNIKQTISQKNITPEQITATDINSAISGTKPASSVEQVIAKENGTTIVNNITNNNVINNINNKIESTSDSAEIEDKTTNEASENGSSRNGLQKSNNKLDNIKKDTLERRAFEDRRYFMDKKNNKRQNDKINKFIHDFDNKQ